jgi:ABC-2 type transport system permease protein
MFLVTSIAMQRERTSGTLERLLTTPMGKLDLLGGYAAAFSTAAAAQAALACIVSFGFLGLTTEGSVTWVLLIAVLNAILGVALGLLCSAFARTEFQAVQFMPVVVVPQLFLCGLLVPRDQLPTWLEWISNVLPLSYAVNALQQVATHPGATGDMWRDLAVVTAFALLALSLGAATLRRRTP